MDRRSFWRRAWARGVVSPFEPRELANSADPGLRGYLRLLGPLDGRDVLDLGCGDGLLSVYAAQCGARVVAVDASQSAVNLTNEQARVNGVADRVQATLIDAHRLDELAQRFDLVIGRFILHHIEPFDGFLVALRAVMRDDARAVFYENSANNPLLMLCRSHLAGRFGIPKYGDDEERPLSRREVAMIRRAFPRVAVHHPKFVFFAKLNTYVLRRRPSLRRLAEFNDALDAAIHRWLPPLRTFSYHQVIEACATASASPSNPSPRPRDHAPRRPVGPAANRRRAG